MAFTIAPTWRLRIFDGPLTFYQAGPDWKLATSRVRSMRDRRKFGGGRAGAVFSRLLSDRGWTCGGTAASLGVGGPERYFRVCYLTGDGRVAWIVRLVKIGAEGDAPFVGVMTIN